MRTLRQCFLLRALTASSAAASLRTVVTLGPRALASHLRAALDQHFDHVLGKHYGLATREDSLDPTIEIFRRTHSYDSHMPNSAYL